MTKLNFNGGNEMDIWITPRTIIYECPECGNEVEIGQNYCQNCGEPLNWRENEESAEE